MNLLNLVVVFGNYVLFIKIQTTGVPEYLFDLIPETNHIYNTCSSDNVTTFYSRTDVYSIYNIRMEQTRWKYTAI